MATQKPRLWDIDVYDTTERSIAAVRTRSGDSPLLEFRFELLTSGQVPFMVMGRRRGSKESFQFFPKDEDALVVELAGAIGSNGGRIGKVTVRTESEVCELLTRWIADTDFWERCSIEPPIDVVGLASEEG